MQTICIVKYLGYLIVSLTMFIVSIPSKLVAYEGKGYIDKVIFNIKQKRLIITIKLYNPTESAVNVLLNPWCFQYSNGSSTDKLIIPFSPKHGNWILIYPSNWDPSDEKHFNFHTSRVPVYTSKPVFLHLKPRQKLSIKIQTLVSHSVMKALVGKTFRFYICCTSDSVVRKMLEEYKQTPTQGIISKSIVLSDVLDISLLTEKKHRIEIQAFQDSKTFYGLDIFNRFRYDFNVMGLIRKFSISK